MRELAAEPRFRLAQKDPGTATASSESAARFTWTATYRQGSGLLELEASGEGRGGFALRLMSGEARRFDMTPYVDRGPQAWMVAPEVVVTRGGGLGFLVVDDWWESSGHRV